MASSVANVVAVDAFEDVMLKNWEERKRSIDERKKLEKSSTVSITGMEMVCNIKEENPVAGYDYKIQV